MDNGCGIEDFALVVDHFLGHFRSITGHTSSVSCNIYNRFICMGNILNVDQQLNLIKPFSPAEIKKAMFDIGSNRSPGLDGFGSGLFKSSWSIVGKGVVDAVNDFFTSYNLPKGISSTLLVLIPKMVNPSTASDYRPIACCSSIYKCISKLICCPCSSGST